MNFVIAKIRAADGACSLKRLENVPKPFQFRFGISRAAEFPSDASFRMSEDFPKDIRLTDALDNINRLLVASVRLLSTLESVPGALFQNEVLQVKIYNHKGRPEKAPYAIVHQINNPTCLKEADCIGTRHPLNRACFQFMDRMVLDEDRIEPERQLFRAAEFPEVPLVRRDLAELLVAQKVTGLTFHEIDGYEF